MSAPRIVFYAGVAMMAAGFLLSIIEVSENSVKIIILGFLFALVSFVLYMLREFHRGEGDYKLGKLER